jgi:hypothetical protein
LSDVNRDLFVAREELRRVNPFGIFSVLRTARLGKNVEGLARRKARLEARIAELEAGIEASQRRYETALAGAGDAAGWVSDLEMWILRGISGIQSRGRGVRRSGMEFQRGVKTAYG